MASIQSLDTKKYWQLTLKQLSEGLLNREFTPIDIFNSFEKRIETINPLVNAYCYLNPLAKKQAQQSTKRWLHNKQLSQYDGIPVAIKDNISVADMPTVWGNEGLKNSIAQKSEPAVTSLLNAGMIVLGKTNVPELTLDGITQNEVFGTTFNPLDLETTPGGSSGGSVSAVASGMAPCALGTDGGGSIRRPCAHTNLFGLKTSAELISREDGLPRILMDFETIGPITRNYEDLVLMTDLLLNETTHISEIKSNENNKILLVTHINDQPVDVNIEQQTIGFSKKLQASGFDVKHSSLPIDLNFYFDFWPKLGEIAVACAFEKLPMMKSYTCDRFLEMEKKGNKHSAIMLMNAWQEVTLLRQKINELFKQYDYILMPSIAATAWPANLTFPPLINNVSVGPRGHALFTGWVNMAGLPAVALPIGFDDEEKSIGIQIIGKYGSDLNLIKICQKIQALCTNWNWNDLDKSLINE